MLEFGRRLTFCLCLVAANTVAESMDLDLVCEIFPFAEAVSYPEKPESGFLLDKDGAKGFLEISYEPFDSPQIASLEPSSPEVHWYKRTCYGVYSYSLESTGSFSFDNKTAMDCTSPEYPSLNPHDDAKQVSLYAQSFSSWASVDDNRIVFSLVEDHTTIGIHDKRKIGLRLNRRTGELVLLDYRTRDDGITMSSTIKGQCKKAPAALF